MSQYPRAPKFHCAKEPVGDGFVQELELKVELDKSDVDRLAGEPAAGDLSIGPVATKELRTVYFDTPEHDLHAALELSGTISCQ